MWARVVVAIVLLLLPTAVFAQAEKRIALLIGNRAYDASVGALKNPHNDIALVGQALAEQGFEILPPIKDARRSAILGGVRELARKLTTAGAGAIGFLYYSGHGAAEKDTNVNYQIPVDAKEPGTVAFWDESLKLDDILKLLDGARSAAKLGVGMSQMHQVASDVRQADRRQSARPCPGRSACGEDALADLSALHMGQRRG